MYIGGCRLRNDLYCVEWDVKLYYTIPLHEQKTTTVSCYEELIMLSMRKRILLWAMNTEPASIVKVMKYEISLDERLREHRQAALANLQRL